MGGCWTVPLRRRRIRDLRGPAARPVASGDSEHGVAAGAVAAHERGPGGIARAGWPYCLLGQCAGAALSWGSISCAPGGRGKSANLMPAWASWLV